jgi:hypothetical protein
LLYNKILWAASHGYKENGMKVVSRIIGGDPSVTSGVTSSSITNEIPLINRQESVRGPVKDPMIHGWNPSKNDIR